MVCFYQRVVKTQFDIIYTKNQLMLDEIRDIWVSINVWQTFSKTQKVVFKHLIGSNYLHSKATSCILKTLSAFLNQEDSDKTERMLKKNLQLHHSRKLR